MLKYIMIFLLLFTTLPSLRAKPNPTTSGCEQIEQALADFGHMKVGMTRQDVEQYFTPEGGMNWREETRYVNQKCGMIKVNVTFQVDNSVKNEFSPRDRITKLSKLYLEYPITD